MSSRLGPIRQVLRELLVPLVAKEGGRLYVQESEKGVITLHWAGRYSGNPATALIHEEFAVPLLQEVAPGTVVRWTSGHLIPTNAELLETQPDPAKDVTEQDATEGTGST